MKNPLSWCMVLLAVVLAVTRSLAVFQDDPVAPLVQQLKDKDEFVRLKAAKALGNLGAGAKDAVPALTEALKDPDSDVREVVKQALAKIKKALDNANRTEVLATLDKNLKAAKDADETVRRKAATGLGSLLSDPDEIIRLKAVQALGEMGLDAEPALAALKEATKDTDEAVRKGARRTLEKIEAALTDQRAAKTREAVAPLLKELKAAAPEKRIHALEKIAAFGTDAKVPAGAAVVEAMLDRMPAVRNAASEALEKVDPTIQPHLFQLLYGQGQMEAIFKLEQMGAEAKNSLPALLFIYQAPPGTFNTRLPGYTVQAMVKIAPTEKIVVQIVLNEIATGKTNRSAALGYLDVIEVTNKDKVTALLLGLQDELRKNAPYGGAEVIHVLEKIGKDASPAIPLLKQLKFTQNDTIRDAAIKALAKIE
jgi:HEAT repeat protein